MSNGIQTLQQRRAQYALKSVRDLLKDKGLNRQEFKSYAAGFPAMIQMNGLGQAAAFHFSQGGTHRKLYDIVSRWLTEEEQPYSAHDDLLGGITEQDLHAYRVAQVESLLLLDWVKKFAKAYARED